MKKAFPLLLSTVILLLGCWGKSNAQIRMSRSGNITIGTQVTSPSSPLSTPANPTQSSSTITPGTFGSVTDTLSVLKILGDKGAGRIGFGTLGEVTISPSSYTNGFGQGIAIQGAGGFKINAGATNLVTYTTSSSTKTDVAHTRITFAPAISAPTYFTTSDARVKKDIKDISNPLGKLLNLHPVSYRLGKEDTKENSIIPTNFQYGFIAQEARKVFPELVYEDEEGILSMDYQSLIAVLTGCVAELQSTVDLQREAIEELKEEVKTINGTKQRDNTQTSDSFLGQNTPNPFNGTTVIPCRVPLNCANAVIGIYNLSGEHKLTLKVVERGETSVSLDANSLLPGMYIYALIIDGIEVDSKRMIVSN